AAALDHLDSYACTHSLWVPTMFHRMLRLPDGVRNGHTFPHHRHAVHGAAPCPIHVKQAMIDWWGPILDEYYSGSEGIGSSAITSAEWLEHPGSVGRPTGCTVHILDGRGQELPPGETGDIFFESDTPFAYWNDAEKTRKAPTIAAGGPLAMSAMSMPMAISICPTGGTSRSSPAGSTSTRKRSRR
ncbi:MAG: AMP-binding protein, partial [Novosphingobium sp.]